MKRVEGGYWLVVCEEKETSNILMKYGLESII